MEGVVVNQLYYDDDDDPFWFQWNQCDDDNKSSVGAFTWKRQPPGRNRPPPPNRCHNSWHNFFSPNFTNTKRKENPRQSRSVGCMTGLWCLRSHLSRPHRRRRRCRLFCLNIPPSVSHFLFSRLFPLFCMYIRQEKKKKGRRRRGIEFIRQVVRVPFSIDVNAADCLCAAQRQEEEEEELPFLFSSAF